MSCFIQSIPLECHNSRLLIVGFSSWLRIRLSVFSMAVCIICPFANVSCILRQGTVNYLCGIVRYGDFPLLLWFVRDECMRCLVYKMSEYPRVRNLQEPAKKLEFSARTLVDDDYWPSRYYLFKLHMITRFFYSNEAFISYIIRAGLFRRCLDVVRLAEGGAVALRIVMWWWLCFTDICFIWVCSLCDSLVGMYFIRKLGSFSKRTHF